MICAIHSLGLGIRSQGLVIRSLELQTASRKIKFCKSRERIAIRENELCKSRKRIPRPWERIGIKILY